MASIWQELSKEISSTIDKAGKSVVAVDGRSGHTSSGIVWRPDIVLTAAHTIRHETGIRVILGPESSVHAKLAGSDRGSDIALLKLVQEIDAPPAQLSNPTPLAIGDFTVAIARTRRGHIVASSGIISGLMGEWSVARTRIDQFIRPDLNLYPGFSGGVLVAADGTFLGLNTSGLLRGKPITIPSSTLTRIAEEIAAKGHVAQPYIGLVMQPVEIPATLQQKAGVNTASGLLVMHVEPGGPADGAGVLLGDILIYVDGNTLDDLDDIHQALSRKTIGQDLKVSYLRGGQKIEISFGVGERPPR